MVTPFAPCMNGNLPHLAILASGNYQNEKNQRDLIVFLNLETSNAKEFMKAIDAVISSRKTPTK
jgi:hypothetical protein